LGDTRCAPQGEKRGTESQRTDTNKKVTGEGIEESEEKFHGTSRKKQRAPAVGPGKKK